MKINILAASLLSIVSLVPNFVSGQVFSPTEDVMTSAFFQGTDLVRGYVEDARPTLRVSSNNAFGNGPETIYLQFDPSNFANLNGPVTSALLSMTSEAGGFGADATATSPFLVSAHGVNADPFTSIIDDTNPIGTIAWRDFFDDNILDSSPQAATEIDGFGTFEFDVTDLVNDWISGSNQIFAIAITGKNDVQVGDGFLHGFSNNNDVNSTGSTFLTVLAVPEPSSAVVLGLAMALGVVRRRRS